MALALRASPSSTCSRAILPGNRTLLLRNGFFIYPTSSSDTKKPRDAGLFCIWRRERDSNPRYAINVYTLSRRAPSATRTPLRKLDYHLFLANSRTDLTLNAPLIYVRFPSVLVMPGIEKRQRIICSVWVLCQLIKALYLTKRIATPGERGLLNSTISGY